MEAQVEKISWRKNEYEHTIKSMDYVWGIGLVALVGIIITLWLHNYLFALFILVAGVSLVMVSVRIPKEIDFEINNDGIIAGDITYEKKKLKGFKITTKQDEPVLLLETSRIYMPIVIIPIQEEQKDEIKGAMLILTEEKDLKIPSSIQIMDKIGF